MTSQMGKPLTSSGHMTTKTIQAYSNYVLATSNLFNTRENTDCLSTLRNHQLKDDRNSGIMPKRQNNPVTGCICVFLGPVM